MTGPFLIQSSPQCVLCIHYGIIGNTARCKHEDASKQFEMIERERRSDVPGACGPRGDRFERDPAKARGR